jgi:hypothetical protein
MAHYAFINEDNVVVQVIVGKDENDVVDGIISWEDYYSEVRGQRCLRTSYNTLGGAHLQGGEPFRGNYAGIGDIYNEELDAFITSKPEPTDEVSDWILNEETFSWEPVTEGS